MALSKWKKLSETERLVNPWWKYLCDEFELPSGRRGEYHYVRTPGSVMVIARDDSQRFLLVEQYRYLNDRLSLEFPGGGVKAGQDIEEAARMELAEEGGCEAEVFRMIGYFNPYNGVTDEICQVYVAEGLRPVRVQADETEQFERRWIGREEFGRMVSKGELWDGMTLASWTLFLATG